MEFPSKVNEKAETGRQQNRKMSHQSLRIVTERQRQENVLLSE